MGIWVSGFLGSGKSPFAKYLGYILAHQSVLGRPVGDLFKAKFQDEHLAALIDALHQQVPGDTIMFHVSVDRAVHDPSQKLAEVRCTVLLRGLGYEDFELAELEIELEAEGRLDDFVGACNARYENWTRVRTEAQGIVREFRERLSGVSDLRLVPNLDDRVVLNSAPLHQLMPWPEPKGYWREPLQGEYEWSDIGRQIRERQGQGVMLA